jgi:hypothetical protein
MLSLVVKICLAFFALVTAGLAIADVKSFHEELPQRSWAKRLTVWGALKIAAAILTFLFAGFNEYLTYQTSQDADREAGALRNQTTSLTNELSSAKSEIVRLSHTNEYLVRTLDQSVIRAGTARVPLTQLMQSYIKVTLSSGAPAVLKSDDEVEWSFQCMAGRLVEVTGSTTCIRQGYGRLMSNQSQLVLRDNSGRGSFDSRSIGGILEYRPPSEDPSCRDVAAAMQAAECELRLTVWREAKWQFRDLGSTETSNAETPRDQGTQDACRRYEALYGKSCAEAMQSDLSGSNADKSKNRSTLANELIATINSAIDLFSKECHESIMRDPIEVACGKGQETIGEAWNRVLGEIGLPTPELDDQAAIALTGPVAEKEAIDYLLSALRGLASQGK